MSIDRQQILKCAIMLAEYAMYLRMTGKDGAFSADYLNRVEMAESGRDYLISILSEGEEAGEKEAQQTRKVTVHADAAEEEPDYERGAERSESRVERMFGARETWKTGTEAGGVPYWEQGMVKGFTLMKCNECGTMHTSFFRTPQKKWQCPNCRNEADIETESMIPAFTVCSCCGNRLKYKTNLTGEMAEIACRKCGAPIDLELNQSGTAYVTVKDGRDEQ